MADRAPGNPSPAAAPTLAFAGGVPGRTPLTLGAVAFNSEEAPERLTIGVDQMIATHTAVGGTRTVVPLGPSASDITWTGHLFGSNVEQRVFALRVYAVGAKEILLSYKFERYYVIVKHFEATYHNEWLAEYSLTVVVTRDANGALSVALARSIDLQVAGLATVANAAQKNINAKVVANLQQQTALNALNKSITNFNSALQAAGPIAQNVVAVGPLITAAATKVVNAANGYIGTLASTLDAHFPPARQIVGAMQNVITNMVRGQQQQATRVLGGNLFAQSALKYGDPTQAFNLANVAKQASVWISGTRPAIVSFPPYAGSGAGQTAFSGSKGAGNS